MHVHSSLRSYVGVFTLSLVALGSPADAQEKSAAGAKCTAVHGALLLRTKADAWQSVAAKTAVPAEHLVIALFGAELESLNGAVAMKMVADVGQRGPFPVLEAATRFHAAKAVDLDVTLERGIAVFTNQKKTGAARLKLQVRGEIFEVTLNEPKAKLGVEVYGRHVPGPAHLDDPKLDDPVANVVFFALAGDLVITSEKQATRLQAPPGTALYMWDNLTRTPEVKHFDRLPDFAKPMDESERKKFDAICHCTNILAQKPGEVGKSLDQAVRSNDAMERKAAVVAIGALDELPQLMQALGSEHADVRDTAVLVMRHWLGRAPGQSIALYKLLTKDTGYTPVQAKSFLHLCYGIEEEKRRQPATYELLIQALNHSKAPMRQLAHWHLVRLAPEGKSIPYDAAGPAPQRVQAIEAWRRLIPDGELPKKKKSTN